MARDRLIGDYGKFATAVLGAEVAAAATLDAGVWYIATGIDGSTAMPTGVAVGYAFEAAGTETLTGTDTAKPLTLTDKCDIQTWGLDFSRSEIDVTTLCDTSKKYLSGKSDITGTGTGVYTIGITDVDGGLTNSFVDIVRQADAGGTVTIDYIDGEPIVAILYKQKDVSSGESEQFYIAPATITAYSETVADGSSQAFNVGFRIAPNDEIELQLVSSTKA